MEGRTLTKDKDLKRKLIEKFAPLWTADGQKHISLQAHVDYRVFGAVPLELYIQTKDQKYLDLGKNLADQQWAKMTPDGITAEARYWIDEWTNCLRDQDQGAGTRRASMYGR